MTLKISKFKKKHEKNINLESPITNIVMKENVLKISEETAQNTNDVNFIKCLTKKKKRKINESAGAQQENEHLSGNFELLTPKKKKKKHKININSEEPITKIDTKENELEISNESVQNTNNYDSFNKFLRKKEKFKIMKSAGMLLDNVHLSDDFELLTPKKKKKKHEKYINSEEPITKIGTKENVLEISKETIQNTNDYDSFNMCLNKKKKHKIRKSADILLDNEHLNDNFELLTPKKKKKKHKININSEEPITKIDTKENELEISNESVQNTNNYDSFNKFLRKKEKFKIMKSAGMLLDNVHLSDDFELLTPKKKKKKHEKYINSEEPITKIGTKENVLEISKETAQNTNDYNDFNTCLDKKENCKIMKSKDVSQNNEHLSDNFELLTPKKKKKKHKIYINSEEPITKIDTKENELEISNESVQNTNNYDSFNKSLRKKEKFKIMKSAGMLLDNVHLSDNFELLTPKKKKKKHKVYINSEEPITKIDTKENVLDISNESVQNTNNYDSFNKCLRKKEKFKIMKSAGMLLDNVHLSDNFELLTPKKKKKKHEKYINSEEPITKIGTKENVLEISKETIQNTNDYNDFNTCLDKKEKSKIVKSADISQSNVHLSDNFELLTPKKKKRKHKIYINSEELITKIDSKENVLEISNESVQNTNNYDSFNKSLRKKEKFKIMKSAGMLLDNVHLSDNFELLTPKKKKKKHKVYINSEEPITKIDTKENVLDISNESVQNTNNYDSFNKCLRKKEKFKIMKSAGMLLDNVHLSDNFELLTPKKKKKKHEKYINSEEPITKIGTKENVLEISKETIQNTNDYNDFNTCLDKKEKSKIVKSADISQSNVHLSDNFELLTPKKKKRKHKIYINSEELITKIDSKENVLEISNESVQNTNNYDSFNKCLRKKEKHKIMKSAGMLLDNVYLSDDFELLTPKKKKKKHEKYINSEEPIIKLGTKKNVLEISKETAQNTNDYNDFNTCLDKKEKCKIVKSKDVTLDNEHLSDNFELLTPKKKKKKHEKYINSEEPITKIGTKESTLEISKETSQYTNDYIDFNTCLDKKEKCKIMKSADISQNNEHLSDNFELLTLRKIKHENNVNLEAKLYEKSNITVINNDYNSFNECLIEENNYENGKVNDKVLKNKNHLNEKTTTVINENDTSLDLLELTTNNNENKKMEESYMISNNALNIAENIKSLLQNFNDDETFIDSTNYLNLNFNENNLYESNEFCDSDFPEICMSEHLLDLLDSYNLEEPNQLSAIEIKTELKDLKLFYDLYDSFSFVNNDIKRTIILKDFISRIKKTINLDCNTVTQSDITLLKYVGEKMLNKIINKHKHLKVLEVLHIELPDDSKKNKLHFVETQLSKQPSKTKMCEFKQLNPSLRLGVFTKEEDNLILQYWHKFQQEYNISDIQVFVSNTWNKEQKFAFFRYIATGLPNRLLISVFNRFNVLFGNFINQSSFTEQEDRIITKVDSCEAIKNKFSVLNLILNRSRLQLYRRLERLKINSIPTQRAVWNLSKRQELFTYILSETNTENWKDLQNKTIKKNIWINVSKRFSEPMNYEQVKYQWKVLSTMLFCKIRINISKFKLIILEYLIQLNPKYWADINWVEITNKFYPGANSKIIVTMFHWWVCKNVSLEMRNCVRDTLKYLSNGPMNDVLYKIAHKEQKYFPALEVENNILKEID